MACKIIVEVAWEGGGEEGGGGGGEDVEFLGVLKK